MVVSRDEAVASLKEIQRAGQKMGRLKAYSHSAPHFMIWGAVWLVAYSVTDLWPAYSNWAWSICLTLGAGASFAAGWVSSRTARSNSVETKDAASAAYSSRFAGLGAVIFFFFVCLFIINPVSDAREASTLVAIFFPCVYMGAGVFVGWRLFAIGAVAAALIMVGYFLLQAHFNLYMGVVAGGSLILAGLWLRKA